MSTKFWLLLVLLVFSFLSACSERRGLGGLPVIDHGSRFRNFVPKRGMNQNKQLLLGLGRPSSPDGAVAVALAKGGSRKRSSKELLEKKAGDGDGDGDEDGEEEQIVSWSVPHRKRGEKTNPGFNVDYSPPKTHPPSHN